MSEAMYGEIAAQSGTIQALREDARLTTALRTIESLRSNYATLQKIRALALTIPMVKSDAILALFDEDS